MSIFVADVSKMYGIQKALDRVNLSVAKGEVVALLGPNGAGKSTMMKIITCYLPQNEGEVKVCGYNVMTESLKVRQMVGYLPENNPLYPDMYVREYLEFVAGIHKLGSKAKTRVKEMIHQTGLEPEHHKKIGALSKGYRQRVGIAQALIHDPEVLILDEPTSGLDPNQLVEIRNLIRKVGEQKTVLLSTHIMQEVEAVCDRVVIINKGKIVADAPTHELQLLNMANRIIRMEFDKTYKWENLKDIAGVAEVQAEGEKIVRIFVSSEEDVRGRIFRFCAQNNWIILGMGYEDQSVEQVFRKLTFES
ncbi:MAG: gliding motility-associated ABC transporter ATP-binding subunit GldA [Bacteroidetes bacterium]|nr:MAG: gliding motility-associated ABC transporter ATP-binding subunit GldA [Bacteroidota bacterium]